MALNKTRKILIVSAIILSYLTALGTNIPYIFEYIKTPSIYGIVATACYTAVWIFVLLYPISSKSVLSALVCFWSANVLTGILSLATSAAAFLVAPAMVLTLVFFVPFLGFGEIISNNDLLINSLVLLFLLAFIAKRRKAMNAHTE